MLLASRGVSTRRLNPFFLHAVWVLAAWSLSGGAACHAGQVSAATPNAEEVGQEEPGPVFPGFRATLQDSELVDSRLFSIDGLQSAVPEVSRTPALNSSTTPILYLRGQGLDQPAQITRNSPVAVYEDGFRIARPEAAAFQVINLERIEVMPGPQGAFYGPDTTGGVIRLTSRSPRGEFGFTQSAEFGNRNSFRFLGSVDTPSWRDLAATVSLAADSVDGYVTNRASNSNDYGVEKQWGGRVQLRWTGMSHLRADYSFELGELDSTPDYDTNPYLNGDTIYVYFPFVSIPYYAEANGPTRTTYRLVDLSLSNSRQQAHGLTLVWQPLQNLMVRSLTGYRTLHADAIQDYAEALGLTEASDDGYHHHQFSQSLQLSEDLPDCGLSLAAGASYFNEGGLHEQNFAFLAAVRTIDRRVFASAVSQAANVELQWRPGLLRRKLTLGAALGYGAERKKAERFEADSAGIIVENGSATGAVNRLRYHKLDPALTLTYSPIPIVSAYARFSTGHEPGAALESALVGRFGSSAFQPETARSYEAGIEAALFGRRLTGHLAGFSARYRQIPYALPVDPVSDEVYFLNRASVRGVDFNLVAQPLDAITVDSGFAYLHARVEQVDVLAGTQLDPASGSGSPYRSGQNVSALFTLPYTPRLSYRVGTTYRFLPLDRGDVSARVEYVARERMYSNAAAGPAVPGREFDSIPGVGLLNAQLTYAQQTQWARQVRIGLWGQNVLNRKYFAVAEGFGSGLAQFTQPGAPGGWLSRAGAWAEPRSFGLSASYRY